MKRPYIRREVIGFALIVGIVLGIVIDVMKQNAIINYEAEAHYDEPKEVLIETQINWTEERIKQEIHTVAEEYGVSEARMNKIIACESGYDTDIQSSHTYTVKNVPKGYSVGDREESHGLVQIHLPAHKVSKEEAIDPMFAIPFLAKAMKAGKASQMWFYCSK